MIWRRKPTGDPPRDAHPDALDADDTTSTMPDAGSPDPSRCGADPDEERSTEADAAIGQDIGPYHVVGLLGRGGMGSVYLAEQTEPLRRQVALKVIRSGLIEQDAAVRFEIERQALARMNHPNVAQVYEAGTTSAGQPFIAMEYVPGEAITTFCDSNRLDLRRRLELFVAVCAGIHHAHQKGIIHRDVKPSNILVVTTEDGPVPKIIDFGIAKAVDQGPSEESPVTGDRVIGTLQYLSPEAIERAEHGSDIDTRSDVYSLGIVLYQLLVGVLPLGEQGDTFVQIAMKVLDEDAARPSVRLLSLEAELRRSVAAARGLDPQSLSRQLRGDLDWITMKAMAKERSRRYDSAAQLAADVCNHLNDHPVLASPPSATYRTRKFVRRHKVGVASVVFVALALVAGIAGTTFQAQRANREAGRANRQREAAQQVAEFLVDIFEVSDPGEARGNSVTAREILDRGATRIRSELGEQPLTQALLMATIAKVYHKLGLYDDAARLLEQAIATQQRLLPEDSLDLADSLSSLGLSYRAQGRYDEAEQLHRRSLAIREKVLGPEDPVVATGLNDLAIVYKQQGRYAEAEELYRRALRIREETFGPANIDVARALNNLAIVYAAQGRYDEAEALYRRALRIKEETLGPDHPSVGASLSNLADLYRAQGRYAEAEPLCRRALEVLEKTLGPEHPDVAATVNCLAVVLRRLKRYDEAEPLYERALATREASIGADHPEFARGLNNLAVFYKDQGKYEKAEALYRRALSILEQSLGPDHPDVAASLNNLAILRQAQGDYREAESLFRRSIALREQALGADHPAVKRTKAYIPHIAKLITPNYPSARGARL